MSEREQVATYVRWGAAVFVGLIAGTTSGGVAGLAYAIGTDNAPGGILVGFAAGSLVAVLVGRFVFRGLGSKSEPRSAVARFVSAATSIGFAVGVLGSVTQIVLGIATSGTRSGNTNLVAGGLLLVAVLASRQLTLKRTSRPDRST